MTSRVVQQLYEQNILLKTELEQTNEKLENIEYIIKKLVDAVGDIAYVLDNK